MVQVKSQSDLTRYCFSIYRLRVYVSEHGWTVGTVVKGFGFPCDESFFPYWP